METITEENYLKELFLLANAKGEVNSNELSKFLGIKMPTVNSMMKKFAKKKLVHYQSYKPIRLTTKGKKLAGLIIRKHRLTEMYLFKKMGFGWEEVHSIAEQIEHIRSTEFFDKIDELLDYPKFDPHGEPIPDKNGNIKEIYHLNLSECKKGDLIQIVSINDSTEDFLKFLNRKKISIGDKFEIKNIELYDNSFEIISENNNKITLSNSVCNKIFVEKVR